MATGVHQGAPGKPLGGPPPLKLGRLPPPGKPPPFAKATRCPFAPGGGRDFGQHHRLARLEAAEDLRRFVAFEPGRDAALDFLAVLEHGHAAAARAGANRFAGDGERVLHLFDDDFGARRHPRPHALGALRQGDRRRVFDDAAARAFAGQHVDLRHPAGEFGPFHRADRDGRRLADLDLADVGLAEGDLHLQPAQLAEDDEGRGGARAAGAAGRAAPGSSEAADASAARFGFALEPPVAAEPSPLTVSPTEPETEAIVPEIGARSAVSRTSWRALLTLRRAWRSFASAVATLTVACRSESWIPVRSAPLRRSVRSAPRSALLPARRLLVPCSAVPVRPWRPTPASTGPFFSGLDGFVVPVPTASAPPLPSDGVGSVVPSVPSCLRRGGDSVHSWRGPWSRRLRRRLRLPRLPLPLPAFPRLRRAGLRRRRERLARSWSRSAPAPPPCSPSGPLRRRSR